MGENKPPFSIEYRHNGQQWSLPPIWAESWEDAEARIRSIALTGKVVGSNVQTYRVNALTLPLVHIWVTVKCWVLDKLGRNNA